MEQLPKERKAIQLFFVYWFLRELRVSAVKTVFMDECCCSIGPQ
jgi:hypothetical protein